MRKLIAKVSLNMCIKIFDTAIVRHIGEHSKSVDVFAVLQNRLADVFYKFVMALTGNLELSKDFLHRNYNFMVENNAGSLLLKKILRSKDNELDLLGALNKFESRFMSSSDKQTLVKILKPLASGMIVKVKKTKVTAEFVTID